MNTMSINEVIDELGSNWVSSIVNRKDLKSFSGGLLCRNTQATRDVLGTGCPVYKIGRRCFYRKSELIAWMKKKAETDKF